MRGGGGGGTVHVPPRDPPDTSSRERSSSPPSGTLPETRGCPVCSIEAPLLPTCWFNFFSGIAFSICYRNKRLSLAPTSVHLNLTTTRLRQKRPRSGACGPELKTFRATQRLHPAHALGRACSRPSDYSGSVLDGLLVIKRSQRRVRTFEIARHAFNIRGSWSSSV
jgi:hypothetical protein